MSEQDFRQKLPAETLVKEMIRYIGDDPSREAVQATPERVVQSWKEIYGGYKQNVADVFSAFDEPCDGMVSLSNIEFYSTCEHHMMPFFGYACVAYVPDRRVIGISKLARVVDIFARRLQIQERIGRQVVDALVTHLNPAGAACIIEAKHFCVCARGVCKQQSYMSTAALTGVFQNESDTRAELHALAHNARWQRS